MRRHLSLRSSHKAITTNSASNHDCSILPEAMNPVNQGSATELVLQGDGPEAVERWRLLVNAVLEFYVGCCGLGEIFRAFQLVIVILLATSRTRANPCYDRFWRQGDLRVVAVEQCYFRCLSLFGVHQSLYPFFVTLLSTISSFSILSCATLPRVIVATQFTNAFCECDRLGVAIFVFIDTLPSALLHTGPSP